jgi:hypothetical protein
MKTIQDVKQLLKDNPEYAKAFHDYFEVRREELLAVPWTSRDPNEHKKCWMIASFIQNEVLDDFGLKDLSIKYHKD